MRARRSTSRVDALSTVIAVVIGGSLLGIIGALIVIPVAAIIQPISRRPSIAGWASADPAGARRHASPFEAERAKARDRPS
jgi:predicted PurR-regulated permease PerM